MDASLSGMAVRLWRCKRSAPQAGALLPARGSAPWSPRPPWPRPQVARGPENPPDLTGPRSCVSPSDALRRQMRYGFGRGRRRAGAGGCAWPGMASGRGGPAGGPPGCPRTRLPARFTPSPGLVCSPLSRNPASPVLSRLPVGTARGRVRAHGPPSLLLRVKPRAPGSQLSSPIRTAAPARLLESDGEE